MTNHILSLDPSGAFDEGKGTTGFCLMQRDRTILRIGSIFAKEYKSNHLYWNAHLALIHELWTEFPDLTLVAEDYLLYASEAASQINSRFETVQLIGVLKHYCFSTKIPIYLQTASEVKRRWANNVLELKGIIKKKGRGFCTASGQPIDRHAIDSIRHAMHYTTFYNK